MIRILKEPRQSKVTLRTMTVLVGCCSFTFSSFAADIEGVVQSATTKYATVRTKSKVMPKLGQKAEVYFKIPGSNVDVSVATAHVYEITGPNIMLQIDKAYGVVAQNQLVRFTGSAAPPSKVSPSPSSSPPPAPNLGSRKPIATPTPQAKAQKPALTTLPPSTPVPKMTPSPIAAANKSATPAAVSKPGSTATPKNAPGLTKMTSPNATAAKPAPTGGGTGAGSASQAHGAGSAKQLVGTWQSPTHKTRYSGDGTAVSDPPLLPKQPRFIWRIAGDELITSFPSGEVRVFKIISLDAHDLVVRDSKGNETRLTRIADSQPKVP